MPQKELKIVDLLLVIAKAKKFILRNVFIAGLLAVIISLLIPRWFSAKATLLPPTGDTSAMGISALLGNLPVSGFGMGGLTALSQETNLFLAILNSRSLLGEIVENFDLQKRYKTETMEETIAALQDNITIQVNEDGTLSIRAQAKTPFLADSAEVMQTKRLARDMTNALVDELDAINKRIKTDQARNTRLFIEKRYLQNLEDLKASEEALKNFQQQNQAISLPDQTRAMITAAAELKAQITAKEIEADLMAKYVGKSHSDYIRLENELRVLRRKYDEFKYGSDAQKLPKGALDEQEKDLFIPVDKVPDLGLRYVRLFREVTLQEKILEFLLPQYEQARIQEAKDTPTVQILDRAALPERKARPKRALIVLLAVFFVMVLSATHALLRERLETLRATETRRYEELQSFWKSLRSDWRFWKR